MHRFYETRRFITMFTLTRHWLPFWSMNPCHILVSCFFLRSILMLSSLLFNVSRYSDWNFCMYSISELSGLYYMPVSSQFSWFDRPDNTVGLQIIKLLIMQFSPASPYVFLLTRISQFITNYYKTIIKINSCRHHLIAIALLRLRATLALSCPRRSPHIDIKHIYLVYKS
jgi:hypothetical protein